MSHYTTELRFICENYAGLTESEGYGNVSDIIEKSRTQVFDFDFPIFDENYRSVLETKIIKHYYTREIGAETVGLWKHFLDRRMNEIMPYYNKLYESELLEFNPLYDTDYRINSQRDITHDEDTSHDDTRTDDLQNLRTDDLTNLRTDDLNTTRTDNLNSLRTDDLSSLRTDDLSSLQTRNLKTKAVTDDDYTHKDAYSDTPQGVLNGVIENTYLTNFRSVNDTDDTTVTTDETGTVKTDNTGTQKLDNTGTQSVDNTGTQSTDNTGTQTNTQTGTVKSNDTGTQNNKGTATRDFKNVDQYLESVIGKRGTASYSKLLQEFRDTFLNIDMLIIRDIADLFMNIW